MKGTKNIKYTIDIENNNILDFIRQEYPEILILSKVDYFTANKDGHLVVKFVENKFDIVIKDFPKIRFNDTKENESHHSHKWIEYTKPFGDGFQIAIEIELCLPVSDQKDNWFYKE